MVINKWITRDKVWAKRGTSFANVMANLRDDSFILLALMGSSGIPTYQTIHGKLATIKYKEIVYKLLEKPIAKYPDNPRMLVIHTAIDNGAKNIIKEAAIEKGYHLLFLPPFSQKLNPLAQWFIEIKHLLKK